MTTLLVNGTFRRPVLGHDAEKVATSVKIISKDKRGTVKFDFRKKTLTIFRRGTGRHLWASSDGEAPV
jgi:hypothetical protein